MVSKRMKWGIVVAFVCLIAGIIPIPYLAAPAWTVQVVDKNGAPMSGMYVRLTFQNYSGEADSHEFTVVTGSDGRVGFNAETRYLSMSRLFFYTAGSVFGGAHYGWGGRAFGRHATVSVFGRGYMGKAMSGSSVADWNGSPTAMTSTITPRQFQPEQWPTCVPGM